MIMFDYANTLVDEKPYDVLNGIISVLEHAITNPYNTTAEEVAAFSSEIFEETIRYKCKSTIEVHNFPFQNYVYEYFGLEFDKTSEEIERIFENASSIAFPTKNIEKLLHFLEESGIRTGVISNMSFSGSMLNERINHYLPDNKFEFILASSEYIYRKPDRRIFELALRKAKLKPDDVWFCGDNLDCDVEGSASCGMYPIWYTGALGAIKNVNTSSKCLVIDNWDKLINIFDVGRNEDYE